MSSGAAARTVLDDQPPVARAEKPDVQGRQVGKGTRLAAGMLTFLAVVVGLGVLPGG